VPVKLISSKALIVRFPLTAEGPLPKLAIDTSVPLIERVVNAIVPPTVPVKNTFPVPAERVKFLPKTFPLIVPVMVMSPNPAPVERVTLFAVVRITLPVIKMSLFEVVILAPMLTAPVSATVVEVVMAADWRIVEPVAERQLSGVAPPSAPENWMVPVPLKSVRQNGPLTVLANRMSPIPLPVSRVTSWVNVIGAAQLMVLFAVVTFPPRETDPPPFSVKVPLTPIDAVEEMVKAPVWVINSGAFVEEARTVESIWN